MTTVTATHGGQILPLTGIRGLAAIGVVCHHAASVSVRYGGGNPLIPGQPFVDLFFALSGFVIAYVYLRRPTVDWREFALARFARIYPLHLGTTGFMAFAGVAIAFASHAPLPDWLTFSHAWRELTLTTAMPFLWELKIWNFPSWSISVEWWTYFLVFPLLVLVLPRVPLRLYAAVVGLLLAALAIWLFTLPEDVKPTRGWPAFLRAAIGFAAGVGVCLAVRRPGARPMPGWGVDLLFAVALVSVYVSRPLFGDEAWFTMLMFPPLIYGFVRHSGRCLSAVLLSSAFFVFLGDISYSVYLTHPIALNVLEEVAKRLPWFEGLAWWIPATLVLTVMISIVSYYWFEVPAKRLLRGRPATRPAPAGAEPRVP